MTGLNLVQPQDPNDPQNKVGAGQPRPNQIRIPGLVGPAGAPNIIRIPRGYTAAELESAQRNADRALGAGVEGQQHLLTKARADAESARISLEQARRGGSGVGPERINELTTAYSDQLKILVKQEEAVKSITRMQSKSRSELESESQFLISLRKRTGLQAETPLQRVGTEFTAAMSEVQERFKDRPSAERQRLTKAVSDAYALAFLAQLSKDMEIAQKKAAEDLIKQTEDTQGIEDEIRKQLERTVQDRHGYLPGMTGIAGTFHISNLLGVSGSTAPISAREQAQLSKDLIGRQSRNIELQMQPGQEAQAAAQILNLKKQELNIDMQVAVTEAKAITDKFQYENRIREIRLQNAREVFDAESAYENKLQELKKRQIDEIRSTTESLLHTMFTNPSGFGRQLGTTLRDAALRPVIGGISNTISASLQPLIFGQTGSGGIAGTLRGVFGGGTNDLHIQSVDRNSTALDRLTATIASLSGGGLGGGGSFGDGGGGGGGVTYIPTPYGNIPIPTGGGVGGGNAGGGGLGSILGLASGLGRGFSGGGLNLGTLLGAPGGTSGFAGPLSSLGGLGGGVGSGGAGGGLGGFGGLLGGLKGLGGLFGIGMADKGGLPGVGGAAGTDLGMGTSAGSIFGSAGALLGGAGLLMGGLKRGGWTGAFMDAGGGALIGAKFGGPLGAVIGAAAGFGLGLFRMAFETQVQEAQKLVKQMYNINIDRQMAQQIVDLAKSKYSGHVSVAVRDPEVRNMLMLYAAGTGQKVPQSASTPHGGSLVEQSGTLYQQATYTYGQAFTQQSNLPVLGGLTTSTYPSPGGGPMNVSINLNGQAASDVLAGQVVRVATPGFIQSGYSQALADSNGRRGNSATLQQPGLLTP